jgi:SAM-dependent methyltransferase
MTPDPRTVAELYDGHAEAYDEHYRRSVDVAEDRVLYSWIAPHAQGRRVLDLGCGTGNLLEHLRPRYYAGIDVSGAMLERAIHRAHSINLATRPMNPIQTHFLHTDVRDGIALADEQCRARTGQGFDLVVSLWAFPYFPQPVDVMARALSAVRPGGTLIVQGYAPRYAQRQNYILNGNGDGLFVPTTPGSLESMARCAGWEVDLVRGFRYQLNERRAEKLPPWLLAVLMRSGSLLRSPMAAATNVLFAHRGS